LEAPQLEIPVRRPRLWILLVALGARPLAGQSAKLAGPPLVTRQSHVGDGAVIGISVGAFAGAIVGLADRKRICPDQKWICTGPGQPIVSMLGGVAVGGIAGGVIGGLVGAFVSTSGKEAQLGVTVHV
jgi:hypothetical protein